MRIRHLWPQDRVSSYRNPRYAAPALHMTPCTESRHGAARKELLPDMASRGHTQPRALLGRTGSLNARSKHKVTAPARSSPNCAAAPDRPASEPIQPLRSPRRQGAGACARRVARPTAGGAVGGAGGRGRRARGRRGGRRRVGDRARGGRARGRGRAAAAQGGCALGGARGGPATVRAPAPCSGPGAAGRAAGAARMRCQRPPAGRLPPAARLSAEASGELAFMLVSHARLPARSLRRGCRSACREARAANRYECQLRGRQSAGRVLADGQGLGAASSAWPKLQRCRQAHSGTGRRAHACPCCWAPAHGPGEQRVTRGSGPRSRFGYV